jgi:hypothetical protein
MKSNFLKGPVLLCKNPKGFLPAGNFITYSFSVLYQEALVAVPNYLFCHHLDYL